MYLWNVEMMMYRFNFFYEDHNWEKNKFILLIC